MKQFDGLQSLQQPLSGLPQWVSERILQQINQLTHYEPVIGIMGKTGAGKSSLCNALFAGDISPVSDVAACTRKPLQFRLQLGKRFMTIMDLPGVGESELRDAEYAALYREQLPRLDLVLWLIIWSFYTLSNGGAFMAPDADGGDKWHLFNSMNGNDAEMSVVAAGIAVCLIEYSHHACRTECDAMTAHYYRLRDYALQHPEAHAILRIID